MLDMLLLVALFTTDRNCSLDRFGQQGVGIYQLMIAIKRILEITCSGNTVPGWRSYASPDPVGSLHMRL
jgi:hypothetical protein